MTDKTASFAVIGAGIIGIATARELLLRYPGADVTVFEKAADVAAHQTGHNSGVVHAGLYYQPGGLKARLCRRGVGLLHDFALEHEVPYDECGKIVVALDAEEEPRLQAIYEKATANGVPDVAMIGPEQIREIEPNAVGRTALHSPHTAIVDYRALTEALAEDFVARGGAIHFATEVVGMTPNASGVKVRTPYGEHSFTYVVACAGLQSDRVAKLAGGDKNPAIVPFFGQYSQVESSHRDVVRGLVYPVPDPAYPFLGVHVTKRVDGELLVGPNAFLSFGRENYAGYKLGVKDSLDVALNPGFWKFAGQNAKAAVREIKSVVSRKSFLRGAAEYVPALADVETTPITRGIRAQAMAADGGLVDDFAIENLGNVTLIRNAPSPGATSSMAIAEYIVDGLADRHGI
ncbi:L-2-hydroxyglutarate oxidase [Brevibacterium sp. 50QC2O2]|jgi:L-2-hydroxyglutarate oxidase|uniref:L-2-hydroxyglutarate oxidase n=1 Tax=Brevibacterium TaxID=1696 RepID=UPI00211CC13F|nr:MULTISPECIES: L-2-hydroxyglutarate oxidase [unclassified Brevibacterium]MCQ9368814.1 L-2-hydroxyglutarate oxidase [Brevibacterium sp. 91QC2O2]MCQ9386198.1 L-2-hydroxyglutarate oxidase [Brevibacterium sp. 68QC2CO]MCQ9388541.1 L-2-hydroxyglutarate oxidase [Brevibacterium sp. 50QC2O2]